MQQFLLELPEIQKYDITQACHLTLGTDHFREIEKHNHGEYRLYLLVLESLKEICDVERRHGF